MIDSHSHILPGLDDGAKSMDETLGMVRDLYESGFKTLIATPHVLEGSNFLRSTEILRATEQVIKAVSEAGIPVKIVPGAENYIFPDMGRWVREGKLLTLGNAKKHILVELPMFEIPHYTDQVFFELQVQGLIPVLAHPERYKGLVDEPERLIEWAKKGVLFQLDLRSLRGRYGYKSQDLAETLLHSDLIHFIGSDAHRVSRSGSSEREARQRVRDLVGEERFRQLTLMNPQRVLEGKAVPGGETYLLKYPVIRKKTKWKFWNPFR